jgi:uncharacterized membrane protein YkvA (DUF1232 family)
MNMSNSPQPPDMQSRMGLVESLIRQGRLTWRLFNDSRVPRWVKLIPVAGLIYLLSPIDLIPDLVLPGLGQVDDVAVILMSIKLFIDLAPPGVVREYLEELTGSRHRTAPSEGQGSDPVIDVPYVVLDPKENDIEGEPS